MKTTEKTDPKPCQHDFVDSPWEPGIQECSFGCGATRETPVPAQGAVVEAVGRRAA